MKSFTPERFWKLYRALPNDVRKQAQVAYRQFEQNPAHPGLQFKKVHAKSRSIRRVSTRIFARSALWSAMRSFGFGSAHTTTMNEFWRGFDSHNAAPNF
ncbi:MAG: hypothetical protein SGI73_07425 [Chloroflexota bacterium]|nr:hypothetical protein [Chloroflexota bacterium]